MTALLEIKDLVTAFHTAEGRLPAVDGVSLSIERGQTLGLVGESGCGKSVTAMSTLRLIASPGRIESGSILFTTEGESIDLVSASEKQLRNVRGGRIGMIFQEPMTSLNPVFTIGDQIAEVVQLHRRVTRSEARTRALEMLHLVRVADPEQRLDAYPHQLSGGMRQRVMIAIALACEPELFIADEPTTALDVTIQAQILDLLKDLKDEYGLTMLFVSHDLAVIRQIADRVAVLYRGKLEEVGDTSRVFNTQESDYTRQLLSAIPGQSVA